MSCRPADHGAAAPLTALMMLVVALGFAAFRWDVGTDASMLARVTGFGIVTLLVGGAAATPLSRSLGVFTLLALPLAVLAVGPAAIWLGVPLGLAALWLWRRRRLPPSQVGLALVLGMALALYGTASGIMNPLSWERVLLGLQHTDTVAHWSLSRMIGGYGTVTLGVDGLGHSLAYHFGSHAWMAAVAAMAGSDPAHAYHAVMLVVVVPCMVFAIVNAAQSLSDGSAPVAPILLILAAVATLFVLPQTDWDSYRSSESHLLAVTLAVLQMPVLVALWRARPGAAVMLGALACVGVLAVLLVKVSAGAVLCAVYGWALLRRQGPGRLAFWLGGFGLTAVFLWVMTHFVGAGQGGMRWKLLALARTPDWPFDPLYYLHALALPLLGLLGAWYLEHRAPPREKPGFVELLAVALAVGLLPGLVLDLRDGATWFFLDTGRWMTLPLLVAVVAGHGRRLLASRYRMLGLAGFGLAGVSMLVTAGQSAYAAASFFASVRWYAVEQGEPGAPHRRSVDYLTDVQYWRPGRIAGALAATPGYRQVFGILAAARPGAALWVAPGKADYWASKPDCTVASMFLPATTGLPLFYGLGPFAQCGDYPSYGLGELGDGARDREELTDGQVCTRAAGEGFHSVLVLEGGPDWRVRSLSCSDRTNRGGHG